MTARSLPDGCPWCQPRRAFRPQAGGLPRVPSRGLAQHLRTSPARKLWQRTEDPSPSNRRGSGKCFVVKRRLVVGSKAVRTSERLKAADRLRAEPVSPLAAGMMLTVLAILAGSRFPEVRDRAKLWTAPAVPLAVRARTTPDVWLRRQRIQTRRAKLVCTAGKVSQANVALRVRPAAVSLRTVSRRQDSVPRRRLLLRRVGTERSPAGSVSRVKVAPVRPRPAAISLPIVRSRGDSAPRRGPLPRQVGTVRGPAGRASAHTPHLAARLRARAGRNQASAPARLLVEMRAARGTTDPAGNCPR